jgi:hypothetical protein
VQELLAVLRRDEPNLPSREVRIVEVTRRTKLGTDGRLRIPKDELKSILEYEARFDELLRAGFAWINLSYYGLYGAFLIVGVEPPPDEPNRRRSPCTSVNYSGPNRRVADACWDATMMLVVEG